MDFSKKLNEFIEILDCSGKELANVSNIKEPIISCYRNGSRIPKYNSNNYNNLINGILIISNNKNINIDENLVKNSFKNCFKINNIDFNIYKDNFKYLIETLKINVSDLARFIGFDSSFISKIKSGIRKPSNYYEFTEKLYNFVINNYQNIDLKKIINNDFNINNIYNWLISNNTIIINNKFNYKIKYYYGYEGYKEANLEILKQILNSNNKEIYLFNIKDLDTYYLNLILEKGIIINIICENITEELK